MEIKVYVHRTKKHNFEVADCFSVFIDLSKLTVLTDTTSEKKYYGSYLLSRASDEDNYTTWFNIARFRLDD